ncbi:MAG TPA: DNA-directed RNA polymerase subunit P [Candidatus Aenigmarchaeota archaeon]|nr:DNA-directed RNA polymerase subunit P [Candidatus Aenigmarchaeota archaeon]
MYQCINCKKIVPSLEESIRCPYCGGRIFVKLRPPISKKIKAP